MFQVRLIADFDQAKHPYFTCNYVLIYSKFLHERVHAERLADMWTHNTKPPFEDTDQHYPDQYDRVPNAYTNVRTAIIDSRTDECSYNGDDPRYAPAYDQAARSLVARYELDNASGKWQDRSVFVAYVPLPRKDLPPMQLVKEGTDFVWLAQNHHGHRLIFAIPGYSPFFATKADAEAARLAFLNGSVETQETLGEIASLIDTQFKVEWK